MNRFSAGATKEVLSFYRSTAMAHPHLASSREAWPQDPLQAFVLRMAGHGHSISSTHMTFDRQYALDQLSHAHTLADDVLRELAVTLFRQFERKLPIPAH
jgi:hypothetical protein